MKCVNCGKAEMKKQVIDDTVEIPGGPVVRVKGLKVFQCPACDDILMDSVTSAEQTKRVLSGLVAHYSSRSNQLPGKVLQWIRKAIGISLSDFAKLAGGMNPSAFTHAATRNSPVDHYAAILLLALTTDFITGSRAGTKHLEEIQEFGRYIDKKTIESVDVLVA